MAQNFTGQTVTAMSPMAGGNRLYTVAFSFNGTANSFNLYPPNNPVFSVQVYGQPIQITTGSTLDTILTGNSMNGSGPIALIDDGSGQGYISVTRSGTNGQDCVALLVTK